MSDQKRSHPNRLLVKIRRAVQRRWGCKEYIVYFKLAGEGGPDADPKDDRVVFRVATPEDIPWMSTHLSEWAKWCHGGQEDASADTILREQFDGGDITVIGSENKPDGALVYTMSVCHDEFALRLMGDAFTPGSDVSLRRVWVAPNYRRQGIATDGEIFADAEAARRGLRGIWGFVQIGNTASQGLQEKLGYKNRGRARIVTRLGRRHAGVRLDLADDWQSRRVPYSLSHL